MADANDSNIAAAQSNSLPSMVHEELVASRTRKFFRVDAEQEEEHIKYQKQMREEADALDPGKEKLIELIRSSIIGDDEIFKSPFGYRKVTYCDYIASGRSLSFIEDYIRKEVLTMYANTHTTTSITGHQSTLFRHEARQLILSAVNSAKDDKLVFTGNGSTAAINKLVHMLNIANDSNETIVLVGPFEHHSNILPWREAKAKVVMIKEDVYGRIDENHLEEELKTITEDLMAKNKSNSTTIIGAFSAASNVTGIKSDTNKITDMLHRYNALAFWDYACAAPYVKIDMNPVVDGYERNMLRKDAIFISPHKFIGGVETPGILVVKKHLFRNKVPETPGGGTVFFVTEQDHRYLKKAYEREEGGTPSIVGAIRAGLVFQLKSSVGESIIEKKESALCKKAMEELRKNPNLVILGNPDVPRLAVFSFLVRFNKTPMFLHYNFVAILLNDLFGIQVRGGCACAGPYGQALMGIDHETSKQFEKILLEDDDYEFIRPGFTRFSLNYFVDDETINYVIDAVNFVANEGWKLLPYYTFYPETGEWVHSNNKKFPTRRWLHNISYNDGKMEWRKAINMKVTTKEYKKYMEEAKQILDGGVAEFTKRSFKLPETQFLLPEHAEKLRWFVYSNEALEALRGNEFTGNLNCPIKPKSYSAKYEEPACLPCGVAMVCQLPRKNKKQAQEPASSEPAAAQNGDEQQLPANDSHPQKIPSQAQLQKAAMLKLWPKIDKKIYKNTKKAICEYKMIKDGDHVMLGLSGGKDSLTMLHVLHELQRKLPFKFKLAACTVDPQTDSYDPSPLKNYMKQLGIPYYFESQGIIDDAKESNPSSICAWCSRMKRGILYNTCRREGYNVLVLAQHLDDLAESFIMSIFHNGFLRTQKVNYVNDAGDVRLIRPFMYVRERDIKKWARTCGVPIINENCPACFEIPKERARVKTLLSSQEHLYPDLFNSLLCAMKPLLLKDFDKPTGTNKKFKTAAHNIRKARDGALVAPSAHVSDVAPTTNGKHKQNGKQNNKSLVDEDGEGERAEDQQITVELSNDVLNILSKLDTQVLVTELEKRQQKL